MKSLMVEGEKGVARGYFLFLWGEWIAKAGYEGDGKFIVLVRLVMRDGSTLRSWMWEWYFLAMLRRGEILRGGEAKMYPERRASGGCCGGVWGGGR